MANTIFMETGTTATQGFEFWDSTTGAVTSSTAFPLRGSRAIKCDTGATPAAARVQKNGILADAGRSISVYCYMPVAPPNDGNPPTILQLLTAGGTVIGSLAVTSPQQFTISAGGGTSTAGSWPVAQWFRITFAYFITSTTVYSMRVYADGISQFTRSNLLTLAATGSANLTLGVAGGGTNTNFLVYYSHIYVNDASDLSDTHDVTVTSKQAVTLNTNSFDTLGGTGTNRYDRISERPISETNYLAHAASTDVQENFGLQAAGAGDYDISTDRVIGCVGWVWAKRGAVTDPLVTSTRGGFKVAGTTLSLNISTPSVGNTLLIAFVMDGATGTVSCTDNASTPNTYVVDVDKAAASPGSGNVRTCIIRGYIATVTSLTTVTITHPSVTARAAVIGEFRGIIQTSPLDKSTSAVGSGTTASSGATATTSQDDELIFGAIGAEEEPGTFTVGTGMTPDQTALTVGNTTGAGATSNVAVQAQYAVQVAVSAQTADATTDNTDWAACIATYKSTNLGTPKIMFDGTESALLLTTSSALYPSSDVTGTVYPASPAGIGMRSSGATPDTFFYEGGALIASIAQAPIPNLTPRKRHLLMRR